jgi:transposase
MDEETIRSYIESFKNDGMPDIKTFRYKGKQANLNKEQLDELKHHLRVLLIIGFNSFSQ